MSLRPKLKHDRMTVYLRGVPEPSGPGGLRYRIVGPVANEDPAAARGQEFGRTLHATALAFAASAGPVLLRGFLVLPKSVVHYVILVVVCWNGLVFLANYLIRRPLLRGRFQIAAMIAAAVLGIELAVGDPRTAAATVLPLSLLLAWQAAHRVATQHALWMTENLRASWEQRQRYQSEWEEVPRPLLPPLAASLGCIAVHEIATPHDSPAGAGWTTLLALMFALGASLTFRARSPAAAVAAASRAFVFWFNYNLHGWHGPQTFQFEPDCRSATARKAWILGPAALLAAAVSCLTSSLPGSHLGFGDLPEGRRALAGQEPEPTLVTAATLDPARKLFHDQLPAGEREAYLRELRKDSPTPGGRRTLTGHLSAVVEAPRAFLASMLASLVWVPVAPLLFALVLVSSYGPALARFDAALEAPHRNPR